MTYISESSASEIFLNLRIDRLLRLSKIAGKKKHTVASLDAYIENDQDDLAVEAWLRGEREEVKSL